VDSYGNDSTTGPIWYLSGSYYSGVDAQEGNLPPFPNFHMLVDISSTKSDMLFPGGGEVVVASLHRLLKGLAIMVNGL